MATSLEAEEHLRVIRSLMEKATVYRAISAPTALVGGLTAVVAAGIVYWQTNGAAVATERINFLFLGVWLGALVVTGLANTYFLWQGAVERGDRFLSSGMRAALRALWPNYLVAGALTILWAGSAQWLPSAWLLLYALGLLATQHFAPRSMFYLGWAFLIAGLAALFFLAAPGSGLDDLARLRAGNTVMGLTFGLLHLIYAACIWTRKSGTAV